MEYKVTIEISFKNSISLEKVLVVEAKSATEAVEKAKERGKIPFKEIEDVVTVYLRDIVKI